MTIRSVVRSVSRTSNKTFTDIQLTVDALSEGKVDKSDVVQTTGQSTEKVMSQRAVTDLVGDVESVLVAINGEP